MISVISTRAVAMRPSPAASPPAAPQATSRRLPLHPSTAYGWALLTITAAGLAARVLVLGHQPLWRDEAFTELVSRRSWGSMYDAVRHDSAPPLSYVFSHLATSLSTSTWMLRLPQAVAGTAAIPLAAAIARRIGGNRAALLAAAMVATMPALILSARDARMYALAGTLTLAIVLVAWRAAERPDRGRLATLGAVVAAAMLTDYFAAFALATTLVGIAVALRPSWPTLRRIAATCAAALIPVLVWLPFAAPQFEHASAPFWVKPVSLDSILGVVTQFLCGPAVDPQIPHRHLIQVAQGSGIVLGGIAGLTLIVSAFWMQREQRHAAGYVLAAGLGAVVLLVLVSLRRPLLEARYASVMWTPCAVLLGCGLAWMRPRIAAALPLLSMAIISALLVWLPTRSDVPAVITALNGHVGGGDVILADRDLYLQALTAEDPEAAQRTHIPEASIDWFWGVAAYPAGALMPQLPSGVDTVYVLHHPDQTNMPLPLPPGYRQTGDSCATDVCLTTWSR